MRSDHSYLRWIGVFLLVLTLVSVTPAGPVRAAIIVVNTVGDGVANAANCATGNANTCRLRDAVAKSVGGDTINFASGLGTITITHAAGTIMISHDLTIAGAGTATTIIDAETNTQPFTIAGPNTLSTGTPIAINMTFQDLTIQNINITDSSIIGGAVLVISTGTLTLTNVKFLNNSNVNGGTYGGGAVMLDTPLLPPLLTDPLLSAPLVITNCTFTGNQTDFGGGAIEWNGPITITNSTFTNNTANGNGGGADGGAILDGLISPFGRANPPAIGVVTVSNSTFTGNQQGGGDGGAISSNAINATDVTFTGNQTINGFGGGAAEVHLYPTSGSPLPSTLVNVTFDGNIAGSVGSGSGQGGAIYVANGSLTLLNATIVNNSVGVLGGGISLGSGSITLGNTIVAGNTTAIGNPDVDGPITSLGNNLIGTIDGSSGWIASDKTGGLGGSINPPNLLDPQLNPLGSNTGTTQTRLPLPGSPALDAGSDTICNQTGPGKVNKLDQRGVTRPIGLHCDIGATEGTGGKIVPVAGTTPQSAAIGTAFAPALAATVEDPNGTPLGSGISVTFTVVPVGGAGGSFTGPVQSVTANTNASGVATAPTFTANTVLGPYAVTANLTVGPLGTPATFALTNIPGAPNTITPTAGTPQSTAVGTAFVTPLAATVFDASSNHVGSGISVTFTVVPVLGAGAAFPGNATTAAVNTDVNGVATAPMLTANAVAGPYTVTANLTSGPLATPATFTLTNVAGHTTTTTAQNAIAAFSTTAQSVTLAAAVTSTFGTVNAGTVTFTLLQGATTIGSPVTSAALTTGAASVSYALPGSTPAGPYTIQAVYNAGGGFATSQDSTHILTITAAALTGIAVSAPSSVDRSLTLKVGQTVTLTATGVFADHTTQPLPAGQVQWQSSDPTIVKVDANGNVTGQSPGGPVTITGTFNGVPGTIRVTVLAPTPLGISVPPAPAGRPSGLTGGSAGSSTPAPVPAPSNLPSSGPAPSAVPGGR